eukprot:scaffold776_cov347-Pavlova_lutheri.AAC.99
MERRGCGGSAKPKGRAHEREKEEGRPRRTAVDGKGRKGGSEEVHVHVRGAGIPKGKNHGRSREPNTKRSTSGRKKNMPCA